MREFNGRPLPPRMHVKHGGLFYLVERHKWTPLGNDYELALRRYNELRAKDSPNTLEPGLRSAFYASKRNAKLRGIEHALSFTEVLELAARQQWRCALTRRPFSFERYPHTRRRPWAPSLDRIDCKRGYVLGNVRLVCVLINLAINEWGEALLVEAMRTMPRERRRRETNPLSG